MRTSLLTRAAAIAAVTVATAFAVTGTADAAPTYASARTLPTSLSIHVNPGSIKPGQRAIVSGVLKTGNKGLADEVIQVYWAPLPGRKFTKIGTATTNEAGAFKFAVSPPRTRLCLLGFNGTSEFSASHSRIVPLKVS
jgi:hypothetical protein